jgi:hypothetical protein
MDRGMNLVFKKETVKILQNENPVATGRREEKLYVLDTIRTGGSNHSDALIMREQQPQQLASVHNWHKRLGHLGQDTLIQIQSKSTGIEFTVKEMSCV